MDNVRLPFVFDVKKRYVRPLLDVRNMNRGRDEEGRGGEKKINGCDTRERAVVGCHSSDTSIFGATTHICTIAHSYLVLGKFKKHRKEIDETIFWGKAR